MKTVKTLLKISAPWPFGLDVPHEDPCEQAGLGVPIANESNNGPLPRGGGGSCGIRPWALAALIFLAPQFPAWAHAFLDHSKPKVGSTVKSSPSEVRIWFTQELEPAFSVIEVKNAHGDRVTKKKARVDKNNGKLLELKLPKLPPGTYKVIWHVVSVDTHPTQGHFEFTIQ